MYQLLNQWLSDHKGDIIFSCFGIWHLLYLLIIFGVIIVLILHLSRRDEEAGKRAIRHSIDLAFGLYIADFFLMPFAYGEIDLEKLPFHVCTTMCVMSFLSNKISFLKRFRPSFTLLGLASNLIYLIYPAGVGWYQIHPLSYRVIQTLLFHGSMTAYGLLALSFGEVHLSLKTIHRELPVIITMVLWALVGNTLYNGNPADGSRLYNWSFVVQDPFYLLPEKIAPYIMPFVMVLILFTADFLLYGAYFTFKSILRPRAKNH